MKKGNKLRLIRDYQEEINYRILSFTLGVILVFVLVLWGISFEWANFNELRIVIVSFVGTVLSLAIVFIFWEVGGKRSFAKDILELAKMSNNLLDSGMDYYYEDFKHIEWKEELKYKKRLYVVVCYAYTWSNNNYQTLEKLIEDGGELKVFLPNYKELKVVSCLAERFSDTEKNVQDKIVTSIANFTKLGAEIFLYSGTFQTTFYLYDDTAIIATFNHKKNKSYVPAIKTKQGGKLFEFIKTEIIAIEKESILLEETIEK